MTTRPAARCPTKRIACRLRERPPRLLVSRSPSARLSRLLHPSQIQRRPCGLRGDRRRLLRQEDRGVELPEQDGHARGNPHDAVSLHVKGVGVDVAFEVGINANSTGPSAVWARCTKKPVVCLWVRRPSSAEKTIAAFRFGSGCIKSQLKLVCCTYLILRSSELSSSR
jgi:hypothetical protein